MAVLLYIWLRREAGGPIVNKIHRLEGSDKFQQICTTYIAFHQKYCIFKIQLFPPQPILAERAFKGVL